MDRPTLALSCSRGSPHLVVPSPVNQADAAMCVQPRAVARKVIQYIVLYCLTPPRFRRYSSFNLCPASPAWGEEVVCGFSSIVFGGGGIRLVNMASKHGWRGRACMTKSKKTHFSRKKDAREMGHPAAAFLKGVTVAQTEEASDSRVQVVL